MVHGFQMSRDMTKPTKWVCAQRRLRSAWASAQSDQSLLCPHEERLGLSYPLSTRRRLIRLGGCPGWSESSLGAHSLCWFCHVAAQILFISCDSEFSFRSGPPIEFEPGHSKTYKMKCAPSEGWNHGRLHDDWPPHGWSWVGKYLLNGFLIRLAKTFCCVPAHQPFENATKSQ